MVPAMERVIQQSFSVPFDYPVIFTRDVFRPDNPALVDVMQRREHRRHKAVVYLDSAVAKHHPALKDGIAAYFQAHADQLELVGTPNRVSGGEGAKNNLMFLIELLKGMVAARLDRQSFVLVIGGGAVLDAVGFAAALVHRGLRLIRLPTTVLSQNDGGVGVKNAINLSGAKNMLGAFAPPFAVINDFNFLRTLPPVAWTDGIAEAFKVAMIKDADFFRWLADKATALAARDEAIMEELVVRCAELHLDHIRTSGDPFEFGQARPLDFGHWAAHKLEAMSEYRLSHGAAVAIGLALDARYAVLSGWLDEGDFEKLYRGLVQPVSSSGTNCWRSGRRTGRWTCSKGWMIFVNTSAVNCA